MEANLSHFDLILIKIFTLSADVTILCNETLRSHVSKLKWIGPTILLVGFNNGYKPLTYL